MTRLKVCQRLAPRQAAASSSSRSSLFHHRLNGPHHEGKADEGHGHHDAERGEGDLDAERLQEAADPAVGRIDGGQGDAGHGGRQGKGEIDQRIDEPPAGKAVTDQHPGHQHAEDDVDDRRNDAPHRR